MDNSIDKNDKANTESNGTIQIVSCIDKLILLKRINPEEYEIHRGEIRQTRNIIMTTKDKDLAENIVNRYNNYS